MYCIWWLWTFSSMLAMSIKYLYSMQIIQLNFLQYQWLLVMMCFIQYLLINKPSYLLLKILSRCLPRRNRNRNKWLKNLVLVYVMFLSRKNRSFLILSPLYRSSVSIVSCRWLPFHLCYTQLWFFLKSTRSSSRQSLIYHISLPYLLRIHLFSSNIQFSLDLLNEKIR